MRFTSWLRTLTSVWHHGKTIGKGRRAARPRPGYRPRLEALEDRCLLSAGVLDPTFNPTGSPPGTVTTAFSSSDGAGATAVAIQRDGKIVAAGNDGTAFAVARYNGNGSLDTSFNGTGTVTTQIGKTHAIHFTRVDADVALQSDGKIVVGGDSSSGIFALARYTSAGTLDPAFGSKGIVTTSFGSGYNSFAYALAIQPDGKIVLAGYVSQTGEIALARYETDGHLDDGKRGDITPNDHFGTGGMIVTAGGEARDLAVDAAGRLVVVGTNGGYPLVARYNPDGTLDTSLGGTGLIVLNQFRIESREAGVALQADGKIVLTNSKYVIRLNANGSLDTASFNPVNADGTHTSGYATLPFGAGAVRLQSDGKIVVASSPLSGWGGFKAARLLNDGTNDGSPDPSFGTSGITQAYLAGGSVYGLAIQPADGYIVLAGTTGNTLTPSDKFALARFVGDNTCGPQITSFTASPNPVTAGAALTLTAANILDLNPSGTVTQVAFYRDSNGDSQLEPGTDTLLGYGTQTSTGTWTLTLSTTGWASATDTLFAQAEDSYGVFSDPLAMTVTVQ